MSKYRIVGDHSIDGVTPGKTVTIEDAARARRLVRGGHLAPVKPKPTKSDDEESA